ncbi:glycoside hydrolase family 38 C-terminal domain-containing protein [Streptomyces sp. BI20]|uniref:glycoside hydrolase family 38 N-terminal domain-containing protein n=1 Tax=Streptomyces sp. BI20 TaxID=3403460 RepID=UPI003C73E923
MDTGITLVGVTTPALFTGTAESPRQVVRVRIRRTRPAGPLHVTVDGPGLRTPHPRVVRADTAEAYAGTDARAALADSDTGRDGLESVVEVSVEHTGAEAPGTALPAVARVTTPDGRPLAALDFRYVVAEPGWTVRLVPHFHYDPLWWNTQAAYTALWDRPLRPGEAERGWEYTGVPAFTLIPLHLQAARDDPAYTFVISEVDYLKPYWDAHPEDRAELRALIDAGRVEVVGGTYNEPNTNLTGAETTVRSAVHGLALHRDALGADPRTAWQLDVFGHDPSFPALMAGVGLDSVVLARGPHHQWGPMMDTWGDTLRPPTAMQLPAEYEWISPDGTGLLMHYLPAHYSCGWFSNAAPDAETAAEQLLDLYELLRVGAATRNVLIPLGTDFSWPHQWGLDVQHAWNRRYLWPRMEHSGPRAHFDAVRAELAERGEAPLPVTRDMGPIYTGKDVTYVDVKQAHRAAENRLEAAETFSALACAEGLVDHPEQSLSLAWRHLLHASHHDAVTGTVSDQVYLDLLPTWREAADLADAVRDRALAALTAAADTAGPGPLAVTVHNPLSFTRTDLVRACVALADLGLGPAPADAARIALVDAAGHQAPVHVDACADGRAELRFRAVDVPPLGHRTWWLRPTEEPLSGGWEPVEGPTRAIENEHLRVEADPERGGGLCRILDRRTGREVLDPGAVDELVVQDEYDQHPYFEEGPWHLLPKGPGTGSGAAPAESFRVERGPLGARIVASGRTGPVAWTRTSTLWDGHDQLELSTRVDEFTGSDQLLRLRIPADVPGAVPVVETAAAAIGRGFGFPEADTGVDHTRAPRTLDSPCLNWFGLSAPLRTALGDGTDAEPTPGRAVGAAEIVLGASGAPEDLRELVTALGRRGVTATPTRADGPRWGDIAVDSSLPDLRIALGGPETNPFTARVLAAADPAHAEALRASGRVWIPARAGLRETWEPGCDLTDPRALPVLVLTDPAADLAADLDARGRLDAVRPGTDTGAPVDPDRPWAGHTVALLTRGVPSCVIDTEGRLHSTLMRSSTGRPSAEWMDPPRRTLPDGASFQLQHWTHEFEHALVAGAGDFHELDLARRGRAFNKPLTAVVTQPTAGPNPSARSLLTVEPADRVLVETVKRAAGPRGELAVRLRETHGRPATVWTEYATDPSAEADLLDRPVGPFDGRIPGGATRTALLLTESGMPLADPVRDRTETPVFSRYWLHNTGTAPLGDAPWTVTAEGTPEHLRVRVSAHGAGGPVTLTVTAPEGWTTGWSEHETELADAGHALLDLALTPAPDAAPGEHPVRITAHTPAGPFEDVYAVLVPGLDGEIPDAARLWVEADRDPAEPLCVAPGAHAPLTARIGSEGLRGPLRGTALLVSPFGTWDLAGPAALPFRLDPDHPETVQFDVRPPPGTTPGTYWAAVKAVGDGRIAYGPAIAIRVTEG